MKKARKAYRIVMGLIVIIIIAFVFFWTQRPQVELIQTPAQASDLDFIAENIAPTRVPKDGIPPIDNPIFISPEEAVVRDDEIVFGVVYKGEPRAYPSSILSQHEIVNDNIQGQEITVTYCPLTETTLGFLNQNLGVSGKLYNSNLVMYDRATDSLIPQIIFTGVTGALKGQKLEQYPVTRTTWRLWKQQYPNTKVLSRETGYFRDYDDRPYPGYEDALRVWFPVVAKDDRFNTKKIIHGVENNNEFIAIPKEEFKGEQIITLGGESITIKYNEALDTIETFKGNQRLPSFDAYWFAWYAFHPDTTVLE